MSDKSDTIADSLPTSRPRRRIFQNTFFSVLVMVQGAVFSYIITRLLLRAMAVEEYGLYSVLFTGILLNLPYFVRLGIPNALLRFIPELFSQSKYRIIGRLFHQANLLQIGAAFVLLLIVFILAPSLAVWIKFPGSEGILRIFSIGALAYLMQDNIRTLLSGLFKQRTIFLVTSSYNVVRLTAIIYVTQYAYSISTVIVAEVIAFFFWLLLYSVVYRLTIHPLVIQDRHRVEPIEWKRFARYTGLSYLNEVGQMFLMLAVDLFLVTGILGGRAVGYYGIANKITTMVTHLLPYQILRWVIEPLFFSEYGSSKNESAQFGFNLLVKTIFFVTLPTGIWLALMAEPVIVHLFEPGYVKAASILSLMAFFLPIISLQQPLGLILQNAERIDLLIYSKVVGILKIIVGLWLVPKGGVLAMVWISGFAILSQNILFYIFTVTKLRIHIDLVGLLRLVVNAALSAFLFLQIRDLFTGVGGIFVSILCFAAIYLVLNVLHKTFRPEERAFINEHLPTSYPFWKF